MSLTIETLQHVGEEAWNSRVASLPEGTIFQTTYWARYINRFVGSEEASRFLVARDGDGELNGLSLLWKEPIRFATHLPGRWGGGMETAASRLNLAYGYCFYGPLLFDDARSAEVYQRFLTAMVVIGTRDGLVGLRRLTGPIHTTSHNFQTQALKAVAMDQGYTADEWGTILTDLTADEEVLWRRLKSSARKNVRNCQRHGLKVDLLKRHELKAYEALLIETRSRLGRSLPPHYPNQLMWEELRRGEPCVEVFVVRDGETILGAMGALVFNGIVTEIAPARAARSVHERIHVGDLIRWEIIRWGHAQGHRLYDLSGIAPTPKTSKERGIRQFKEKWGGAVITYPYFSKVIRPRLHRCLQLGTDMAQRLFRIKGSL